MSLVVVGVEALAVKSFRASLNAAQCTGQRNLHLDQLLGVAPPFGANRGCRYVEEGGVALCCYSSGQKGLACPWWTVQ